MHYFQGCRGSLNSVSKILGVSCPPLLHLIDAVLHVMLNSSTLLNPDHKYPFPLTWIHRCATLCNAPFSRRQSIPELVMHQFWGWAVHRCYTDVRSAACGAQQLRIVEPCPVISPTHTPMHRYSFFCNAPFSRMQSMAEKFMIHLTQLSTISSSHVRWHTGMLNSLHQDMPNRLENSLKTTSIRYKPY